MSNHAAEHKHATYNCMTHRMNTIPIIHGAKSEEHNIIKAIALNNGYHKLATKLHKKIAQTKNKVKDNLPTTLHESRKIKCTKFTYFGPQIRTLTKLLKHTNVRIAYSVNNTIKHKTKHKKHTTDKYSLSGIYKLKYNGCEGVHISQTGRSFSTRFSEHISDIRFNRDKSKYAKHILDHQHEYGKKEETMEILKVISKGNFMDSYERYYIQKYSKKEI
jgi:hypothetical protein